MDWTERDGNWVSGPYTIELLVPGTWSLVRRPENAGASAVQMENEWTGHSLRLMKQHAEEIEAEIDRARRRRRYLSISAGALVVFVMVVGTSGPVAGTLGFAAVATLIYGIVRAINTTNRRRPWDSISETFQ